MLNVCLYLLLSFVVVVNSETYKLLNSNITYETRFLLNWIAEQRRIPRALSTGVFVLTLTVPGRRLSMHCDKISKIPILSLAYNMLSSPNFVFHNELYHTERRKIENSSKMQRVMVKDVRCTLLLANGLREYTCLHCGFQVNTYDDFSNGYAVWKSVHSTRGCKFNKS